MITYSLPFLTNSLDKKTTLHNRVVGRTLLLVVVLRELAYVHRTLAECYIIVGYAYYNKKEKQDASLP